jgi:flagellar FliL protein
MSEETVATPENAAGAAASAAKPKLVMVLAIALAGIGSGGAAGAFVAGPMIAKKMVPPVALHADSGKAEGKEGEHGKGEGKEGKEAEGGASLLLDNMVLNPAGSGGGRYLLASISIRYANAGMKEKFTAREAEIRDGLLHVLGTKTIEQLTDVAAREALKNEIKEAVDAIMGPKTVTGVFFPQFVIQ